MSQESESPSAKKWIGPIPRRRRSDGFFTPSVLLLLTAVLLTLIGILLLMSSAVGFFSEDYPLPGIIINVAPSPTIGVVITNNSTPCSSLGKICDTDDPSAVFQPIST